MENIFANLFDEKDAVDFLKSKKIDFLEIKKIAGDCSFRIYYRVFLKNSKSLILMHACKKRENLNDFIKIDKFLLLNNIKVPKIYEKDESEGFILLEDLGDESLNKFLTKNKSREIEEEIYKKTADILLEIHKFDLKNDKNEFLNYNHQRLFFEFETYLEFYLKYIKNFEFDADWLKKFKKLWFALFDKIDFDNKKLVLRDYHADNLMIIEKDGLNCDFEIGLLDFQDAVLGSKAYDLVSLLEDARRDVDFEIQEKILSYYIENAKMAENAFDESKFLLEYEILSLQRNIKILGIFARMKYKFGRDDYLRFLPRVQNLVKNRIQKVEKKQEFAEICQFLQDLI